MKNKLFTEGYIYLYLIFAAILCILFFMLYPKEGSNYLIIGLVFYIVVMIVNFIKKKK